MTENREIAIFRSSDGRSAELAVMRTNEGIEAKASMVPHWVRAWNLDLQVVTIDGNAMGLERREIEHG